MADYIPIRTPASALANVPIVDGQIITVYDTGEMYVDKGAVRQRLSDVIADTYANIVSLLAPLNGKIYFATDTHQLLQYSGGSWVILNDGGGGGSVVGDWGTRVVTKNSQQSIVAVPNIGGFNDGVRGNGAVDLQMVRNHPTQIASGMSSFVAGRYNKASGAFATTFGEENVAAGKYSAVFGNQNRCKTDGVVCNNNILDWENPTFFNVSGNCGFKGIKTVGLYNIPIWKLALTDVLIAKIHIVAIGINGSEGFNPHQIQNIVVENCSLLRNDYEFSSGSVEQFTCTINNGVLYITTQNNNFELQVGMFYTLYSESGANDSSCSSSGGYSSSSSSGGYYPDSSSSSSSG